jgi:RNA polymerase primary sigma factor
MPDQPSILSGQEQPTSSPLPRPLMAGETRPPQLGLLEPDYHPHYTAWMADPSPKNAGALVKAVQPVLDAAVRTYVGGEPSPTIKSRAKLLALDAAARYDPSRAKLRTHLMVHLQGLRRYAARENQIVGVPERVGLDLHRIRTGTTELADRLGRDPTDQELADHVGLSRKRIGYVRQAKGGLAEGQLSRENEEGGVEAFQPAVVQSQDDNGWTDLVYHDLHPTDQIILEHSLGLHGKQVLSKQKIAAKLRLSPGAVSQRAARIQAMLDKREELGSGFL